VGELRDRIIRLRNEAEYLRGLLDVPPGVRLGSEAVLLERIYALRTLKVENRTSAMKNMSIGLSSTTAMINHAYVVERLSIA